MACEKVIRTRDGHSSWTPVTRRLQQPTRTADPDTDPSSSRSRATNSCRPYSVLLPVGFAVPPALPPTRCALTAPFHPCRPSQLRGDGGLFSVALSLGSHPPDVIRHRLSMEPGLSSPAPFRVLPERPSDRLTGQGMGSPEAAVKGRRGHEATTSRSKLMTRAAMVRGRPRWASKSCKVFRVEMSVTPSTRSGRKWRWNAVTTSCMAES